MKLIFGIDGCIRASGFVSTEAQEDAQEVRDRVGGPAFLGEKRGQQKKNRFPQVRW